MPSAEPAHDPAAAWDIATPSRPCLLPGLGMAGFRARGTDTVDLGMVPNPAVTVVVNLGDELLVLDGVSGRQHQDSVVVALAPSGVRGGGRHIECLQIRLSPVAAHTVLGPSSQRDATVVSLEDLWGHDARRTQEQLRAAGSWDERFAIAQTALLRRHETGRAIDPEVAFAWEQMVRHLGAVRVEHLAAEAGWSRKRLWSRFRDQMGLNPKRAAQLVRFDHAAHRLAAGRSAARVAAELGYADQSHLHRDVMAFTGVTPAAVAAAPWLAIDNVAWTTPEHPPAATRRRPPGRRQSPRTGRGGTFLQDARQLSL
ncbi:helix-turn-helix domain-containing protein [Streptomyces sp. NPDC014636]|uniref:helix-turn-helix domain-containing protein n=1 Tax=Streptomyces sp. NPDC014636 TaxID=3364876 RepID=UPI0036FE08B0